MAREIIDETETAKTKIPFTAYFQQLLKITLFVYDY